MSAVQQRCAEPVHDSGRSLAPTTFATQRGDAPGVHAFAARPRVSAIVKSSPSPINWGPAPATFPAGARMAVLQGDPTRPDLYIAFLRLPDGYELPPHTHATDEHVTVITGMLHVGTGTTVDQASMRALCAGGATTMRAGEPHYARAQGVTIVQVNARGPLRNVWVDDREEPRSRTA